MSVTPSPGTPRPASVVGTALALTAVVLVSLNLRPGASSVGAVLAEVRDGLGMGSGLAGALTGMPGLAFGLVGAMAVGLGRRVGATAGIAIGLAAVAAGLLLRTTTDSAGGFLVLTVVALGGMAVGNVLVPAWIKRHGGSREVLLSTCYGTGLVAGGSLGSLLTPPLESVSGDWRSALAGWGVLAAIALPLWVLLAARTGRDRAQVGGEVAPGGQVWRSRTALALAAFFGVQAMHAYVQFGWLPQIYRDAGLSATHAGALQALLSGITILGGLSMPTVVARSATLAPYVVGFGASLAAGYIGLLVAPATVPWLWAVLLGLSGFAFPTAIALITARTRHPSVTARLSGFAQPVGYALAALGPFVVGLAHEATGDWTLVLAVLAATAIPLTWAGLRVSRPVLVDDELAVTAPP